MFDFSHEEEQKDYGAQGPVPSGSIVWVLLTIMEPANDRKANDNPLITVAGSGLRQLYCQFRVGKGEYTGVEWRQNITLPAAMQTIRLTEKQEQACRIGGSTIKAILEACRKPARINSLKELDGLKFPVRVKLNKRPFENDEGKRTWRNELACVITPNMPQFAQIKEAGELINPKGSTKGDPNAEPVRRSGGGAFSQPAQPQEGQQGQYDDTPFGASDNYVVNGSLNGNRPRDGDVDGVPF